jgi:hypothetical protein
MHLLVAARAAAQGGGVIARAAQSGTGTSNVFSVTDTMQ